MLVKYGLDEIILAIPLFSPIRFLKYFNPWYWSRGQQQARGERVRQAFEALGPIFIKLGQMLSTRNDLIPEDIAYALASLQDRVPPFNDAETILKHYHQYPMDVAFREFNKIPLASASIAQVHCAALHNGEKVAVKILRPHIHKAIQQDIPLMYLLAKRVERYWPTGKQLNLMQVVKEFETTITQELDFMREAANASLLKRHFKDSQHLAVPYIHWPLTTKTVLVMEYVTGIPIYETAILKQYGINLEKLAENIIHLFFTQVFFHRFFHADLHPGNLFVNPNNPHDPQCIAVDFGIVGSINASDQRYLAENMLAFFNRDYQRVAELHVASGWVPADTRIEAFEGAIRTVCEPIFEKPLNEISVGRTLMRLLQTAREFKMEVLPQFILLQKTLLSVESLGRQLHPTIDLWATAQPILKRWLKEQVGARATLCKIRSQLPYWLEKMPYIPDLVYQQLAQKPSLPVLKFKAHEKNPSSRTHLLLLQLSVLLLLAAFLTTLYPQWLPLFLKSIPLNWIFACIGMLLFSVHLLSTKRN